MSKKNKKQAEGPTLNTSIQQMHQVLDSLALRAGIREEIKANLNSIVADINKDDEYNPEEASVDEEAVRILLDNIEATHANYLFLKAGFRHLFGITKELGERNVSKAD